MVCEPSVKPSDFFQTLENMGKFPKHRKLNETEEEASTYMGTFSN